MGPAPRRRGGEAGENLFPRIDVEKELAALDELQAEARRAALPAVEVEPFAQESVDFDTFCKSDFRAVKVKACESVKKSAKLLRFILDDGSRTDRQILSGIAMYYKPEELVGKTLVAIINLPPQDDGAGEAAACCSPPSTPSTGEELHLVMVDDAIPRRRQAVLSASCINRGGAPAFAGAPLAVLYPCPAQQAPEAQVDGRGPQWGSDQDSDYRHGEHHLPTGQAHGQRDTADGGLHCSFGQIGQRQTAAPVRSGGSPPRRGAPHSPETQHPQHRGLAASPAAAA